MEYSGIDDSPITIMQREELIDYYDALEMCVRRARELGCFHTHFGIQKKSDDYCLIKAMMQPDEYPDLFQRMYDGMRHFQHFIFSHHLFRPGQRILDIGCGVGGSLGELAQRFPQCTFEGVNLNRYQLKVARDYLAGKRNVMLHYADVTNWENSCKYDLVYCIESAFHIETKADLCRKIEALSKPGTRVILVDIFLNKRLAQRMRGNGGIEHAIFNYLSVEQWSELMPHFEIEMFTNCTSEVSPSFVMQTEAIQYQEILDSQLTSVDGMLRQRMDAQMWDLYYSYRALHRMLQRGRCEYGVLVLRRQMDD